MNYLNIGGHKIAYIREGVQQGKSIIFLHNGGTDHRIWDHQFNYFKQTHDVIAIDLLGYGLSDKPQINYSLWLYSFLVGEIIRKLELDNVILVGHCIGSAMALHYTSIHPEKIHRLILFNLASLHTLRYGVYNDLYNLSRNMIVQTMVKLFAERLVVPKWLRTIEFKKLYGKIGESNDEFLEHLHWLFEQPTQMRVLYNLLVNFDSFQSIDHITGPVNCTSLSMIWGELNQILPKQGGIEIANKLNPDHFKIVQECGHMVMREKPDLINEMMDEWING
ncbi:MAG: alpha/beta hydrolase [Desulfobacterales bacterium]|nr:alpha/beta hydrolase [Desulfobacterales bacterium]